MSDAPKMGWFVAQLRPNGLAQARVHLRRQRFESFSPERVGTRQHRGCLIQKRQPLFPGYLFVQFDPAAPGWTAINNTRGIARLILQDPRRPRPLPQSLIAGLQARCRPDELVKSADDLEIGEQIRILSGPFADFITQVDQLPDSERVGVLLDLMGRDVRTSLHRSQVSKLG
ncbi:transcriptional activator RfaH [Sulfitobacter sp. Ks41]|uniref:Transcription termination/antitermination NusG family protein n=1 Tax=Sulfitobacter faviae TaxID=1775881 RepID=A0AAX3LVE5_9RHOB|nr:MULTISPECIES: transcription termination/antitermination NusG family protein [Sulfitobacter]MDF3362864.1 transcriptional activator RfaH [Sulfitobacter sp. Ks41]WCE72085.1 transcription termination/antitermination NusG family protein [Sulfitobacter faviae]